jgi:hypothetical protein
MYTTFSPSCHLSDSASMPSVHRSMKPCNILPALLLAALVCAGTARVLQGDVDLSGRILGCDQCAAEYAMCVKRCTAPLIKSQRRAPGFGAVVPSGESPQEPDTPQRFDAPPDDTKAREQRCRQTCMPVYDQCKAECTFIAAPLRKKIDPTWFKAG